MPIAHSSAVPVPALRAPSPDSSNILTPAVRAPVSDSSTVLVSPTARASASDFSAVVTLPASGASTYASGLSAILTSLPSSAFAYASGFSADLTPPASTTCTVLTSPASSASTSASDDLPTSQLSRALTDLHQKARYEDINTSRAYKLWKNSMTPETRAVVQAIQRGHPITKDLLLQSRGRNPLNENRSEWYMIVIVDENDPTYYRVYIRQGADIAKSLRQHQHTAQNHAVSASSSSPSSMRALLYDIWKGNPTRRANFLHLGGYHQYIKYKVECHLLTNIGE